MPDPTPNDGFTVNINDVEQAATKSLPAAANALRAPISDLVSLVDFEGPNVYSAADRATKAFGLYKESVGRRQMDIARVVDEAAEALMDIVTVYKRADGQV
jgi:hypothetical protein